MANDLMREEVLAKLEVKNHPEGTVLSLLNQVEEWDKDFFDTWETPLAPYGRFNVSSGLAVVADENVEVKVLEFTNEKYRAWGRSIVGRGIEVRDCRIKAEIKSLSTRAIRHMDRPDCTKAIIGPVFRIQTSREYYQFGIEGRERIVVYRRCNDEWFPLAQKNITVPDGYLTLEVLLDGDAIRCKCPELDTDFLCTDNTYKMGKAGIRSVGRAFVRSLSITQTQPQKKRDKLRSIIFCPDLYGQTGYKDLPDAVLKETIDLKELGGEPVFMDFAESGRYDMLISKENKTQAVTMEGKILWEFPCPLSRIVFSPRQSNGSRLIYGFTGERYRYKREKKYIAGRNQEWVINDEMVVIDGANGVEIGYRQIPETLPTTRFLEFSPTSGRLTGDDASDIVLREWRDDKEGGGDRLWVYNKNLELLWKHQQPRAWYGHHYALAFKDVNGDGRDELLAGGSLYDRDGNIIWEHDRMDEVYNTFGGTHYDAVTIINSSEDGVSKPVAFLAAGSAGVYVVDALTGKTQAHHRIGHAQGQIRREIDQRDSCKVRDDYPDEQVAVVTRWGNFGIITLFSARGEKIWSIQPDYIGQGAINVKWGNYSPELIWVNTTKRAMGLYDGYGQCVKKLPLVVELLEGQMNRRVVPKVIRMGKDNTDLLVIERESKLHIFKPEGAVLKK